MARSPKTDYAPKRLDRRSLETTRVTPGMRLLSTEDREAMIEKKVALEDRVSAFGTVSKARLVRNVTIACLGMPLISSFFWLAGFETLLIQLPIAVLVGVAVTYLHPSEQATGILFGVLGMLTMALCGYFTIHPRVIFTFFAY